MIKRKRPLANCDIPISSTRRLLLDCSAHLPLLSSSSPYRSPRTASCSTGGGERYVGFGDQADAAAAMGVWESILRGGGRRFLKRKDSDAGEAGQDSWTTPTSVPSLFVLSCLLFWVRLLAYETKYMVLRELVLAQLWDKPSCYLRISLLSKENPEGRALEELRGSLFNDFHTSEGAKRQQQRLCGPIVALTFNFVVAVGIIMANKMVMGAVGFNFPIALSLIHYLVAWILMAVLKALYLLPIAPPSKSTPFSSLFALGVVMSFSTGLANVSLKHNSVGFYQMAKIAVTPTIVVAEFFLFQKKVSLQKVITLVVVSFGVSIATVTDLEFNFFGACVALAWIIPSAVNKILWSNLQQSGNWTALALMWKTTPITIFFFIVLMPLLDPPGFWSFSWNFKNSCAVIISALFGFLLQWSGALALGATSALSHVVLGQFKTIVIMLSGYLVFNSDPGFTSLCGAVIALVGMSVYTYLGIKESATGGKKTPSKSARQNSPLLKSKVVKDGEKQETRTIESV
ncbi:hypothetical protein EJB05_51161, partial [Eragrostis curvula]